MDPAGMARGGRRQASARPRACQGPVTLHGHHLAAAEGGHQLERDGWACAWNEADSISVATDPALKLARLLLGDHDVSFPGRAAGEEAPRQVPVADMRARRD